MKRNKINATSITMHPIFLEDYFVAANYFTGEMQHCTRFQPLSELKDFVQEDYNAQIEAIFSDSKAKYIQNKRCIYNIHLFDAPLMFEKIANYFACHTTVSNLILIKCFGWRFEHCIEINKADICSAWQVSQPKIYSPWQVDQDNITLTLAKAAVNGVLSGLRSFQNPL